MIKREIALKKENVRIKTMEKMKFGWWYVQYAFAIEPMAAFGIWEDECKRQFPEYDDCSVLEMVDVYTDCCRQGLMPKNFLVSIIDAITFPLFKFRWIFCFFLVLKHKIGYRIDNLFDNKQTEIVDIDTTDWE